MWHIMYEEIDKPQQGHRKERKVHSLRVSMRLLLGPRSMGLTG